MLHRILEPLTCVALLLAAAPVAYSRSDVQRDVEGYAIATCLSKQDQPYLQEQGDAWASVIIQRSKGILDAFMDVSAAVKIELAKGGISIARVEQGSSHDMSLPVQYCSEIIDVPFVHAAIRKAVRKLKASYRRP